MYRPTRNYVRLRVCAFVRVCVAHNKYAAISYFSEMIANYNQRVMIHPRSCYFLSYISFARICNTHRNMTQSSALRVAYFASESIVRIEGFTVMFTRLATCHSVVETSYAPPTSHAHWLRRLLLVGMTRHMTRPRVNIS